MKYQICYRRDSYEKEEEGAGGLGEHCCGRHIYDKTSFCIRQINQNSAGDTMVQALAHEKW